MWNPTLFLILNSTESHVLLNFLGGGLHFLGKTWRGNVREWDLFSKRLFKTKGYADHVFGGLNVIRTKNTCFEPSRKKYYGNNIYLSDTPEDYLNIYANAEAVFSDRVHTCVGALAQGIPAMFMGNTPRANLFKRVMGEKYESIFQEPVTLAAQDLDRERERLKAHLGEVLI